MVLLCLFLSFYFGCFAFSAAAFSLPLLPSKTALKLVRQLGGYRWGGAGKRKRREKGRK